MNNNCIECGIEFSSPTKRPFCSESCRHKMNYKKKEIKHLCLFCKKEFISSHDGTKFCCGTCAAKYKRREMAEIKKCKVCGKALGKLVRGKIYCSEGCHHAWEKENPKLAKICQTCGNEFKTNDIRQKHCSYECAGKSKRSLGNTVCKNCGKEFRLIRGDIAGVFCSRKCSSEYQHKGFNVRNIISKVDRRNYNNKSSMKRALRKGVNCELIDIEKVFERDKWICKLCGEKIDKRLIFPHPLSPSLDHIVPLKKLGSHTYNNVQASHLRCNCRKGG